MIPRPTLIDSFVAIYPEFAPMLDNPDTGALVAGQIEEVICLYAQYDPTKDHGAHQCVVERLFFLLVAHYLAFSGKAKSIGIGGGGGIVASSSIDSVSVSYQSTPYNTPSSYFFGQTPYGQQYLALLAQYRGVTYFA